MRVKPSHFFVVTNCTARKRTTSSVARLEPRRVERDLSALCGSWKESLDSNHPKVAASHLYAGRSICLAKEVSKFIGAELLFVSAGLGLVPSDAMVPAYDLTTGQPGGFRSILLSHNAEPSDWWRALTGGDVLKRLIRRLPRARVLLSLPLEYVRLLSSELMSLSESEARQIFVFTSRPGQLLLSKNPGLGIMPYDDRLESLEGFAGTRADFPQRALRHFVAALQGHMSSQDQAESLVLEAMEAGTLPETPKRKRLDDLAIARIIREGWNECNGSSARLLRYVRDKRGVACEQARFSALWRSIHSEGRSVGKVA